MSEASVSIDRTFMNKTAGMLRSLACTVALCLTGCISPDLEPPVGGSNRLPANPGAMAPRTAAEAADDTASTPTTTPSGGPTTAQPGPGKTTPPAMAAAGSGALGAEPGLGAPGDAPNMAMTPPPATTGAAPGQAPSGDGAEADAGVEAP